MNRYFKILPHQKLKQKYENIYTLVGSMQLFKVFKYSRNMVILKSGNKLCLVNPIRLSAQEEKKLLELGSIHAILKLGRLHSVDLPYYMDRFSPKLWASRKDSFVQAHNYPIDIDLETDPELPFLDLQIYSFKTSKENEAIAFLPKEGGIVLACDAFVNMKKIDPMANWIVKLLSNLLDEPTYIGPNWYKIMRPSKEDFDKVLSFDFDKMIPAHGPILDRGANKKIRQYLDNFF